MLMVVSLICLLVILGLVEVRDFIFEGLKWQVVKYLSNLERFLILRNVKVCYSSIRTPCGK